MRTKHTSIKSKKIMTIIGITLLGLIAIAIFAFVKISNNESTQTSPTKEQINTENETSSEEKQDFIENNTDNTDNSTWQDHSSNDIDISTNQEADGSVTVAVKLKNYSDGTCQLNIKSGNNEYSKTADIIYQSAFSICSGFSVPANSLPSGTWQITISTTSKGEVTTKTVSAEIN